MGQRIGKLVNANEQNGVVQRVSPLLNLPKSKIIDLRCAVTEISESGYSVTKEELEQVLRICLHEFLSDEKIREYSNALFNIFNANAQSGSNCGEIDSFEMLGTLCLLSGMVLEEKVDFIFDLFDLNERGELYVNETTLAFRSLQAGVCKMTIDTAVAANEDIDQVALEAFDLVVPDSLKYSIAMADDNKLTKQQFRDYVFNCPEAASFLHCYDDIVLRGSEIQHPTTRHNEAKEEFTQPHCEHWRDQQRFLRPITEDGKHLPPMDGLKLQRICGRNSGTDVAYTSNGDILYAAGSIVIVADKNGYQQEFFNEHSNLVSSLDVLKVDGLEDIVASADIDGNDCKVCVWSSNTLSSLITFSTRHKNGVSKLCFSPSGELLLTIGSNDMHVIIEVYEWRERRLLFASKLPGSEFHDCSFLRSDNSFGICGENGVYFWIKSNSEEYKYYPGVTNLFPSQNVMTSIACIQDKVVTGSKAGTLLLWEGRVCLNKVETFRFPITNLTASEVGLFVSTQDGTIHLLGEELESKKRVDSVSNSNNEIIHSMCWEPRREKLLVGDDSNCLREVTLNSVSTSIMSSHSTLSSFAVDYRNENIITVGHDGFVRKWNSAGTDVIQQRNLVRDLSCIACNRSDIHVVVCFSKDKLTDKTDDAFVILSGNDLCTIHHGKNSQVTLTMCKFSNDGKLVAFGSKDGSIYIHSIDKDFPLLAKTRGHTAPILTFDFGCAEDSSDAASFIRSNSVNGEALYWSTHGKKQTPLSQRQTHWESHGCVNGWYLEGAHDVNLEEGSAHITSCCPLSDKTIVVGDSRGKLRVFSNPVLSKESIYLQFGSHHRKVQEIARCGETLYSFGGNDSCLCIWEICPLNWPSRMPPSFHDDHHHSIIEEKKDDKRDVSMSLATEQMENLDFSIVQMNSNAQKPLQPWMRSIAPPSRQTPKTGQLPSNRLILEFIHGYNGRSTKHNLHYLPGGESILYSVGKTLVKFDEAEDKQQYCAVTGNISCLAVHPERSLCAIGQKSNADESIVIVDFNTMKYSSMIKGAAKDTVRMDFDRSGKHLLALSENRLNIHDIDNECRLTASTLTHATETLDVCFATNANTLVEVGKNFVRFWVVNGSEMHFEDVDMSSIQAPTTFYTCIGWICNDLIVGASSGDVIRFAGRNPISKIKAHTSKITNIISSTTDDRFAVSAGSCIKVYDSKFRCTIVIGTKELGVRNQISSLSWHPETRKILIGTTGNEVWELSSDDGSNICEGPLICSHSSSPTSISAHPNGSTFATVADDGFLHVWGDEHLNFDLGMPSRACAYSPDGRMLAVGLGKPIKDTAKTINGKWIVIDVSNRSFRTIAERRDTRKFIREMKWYSSGDRLAVGSDKIYVYSVASEAVKEVAITLVSTIDITSPPIHFDYSRDGKYLRVNTEANELMWYEADPAIRIEEASMMKDVEWESETCVFSWNCQGVHHDEAAIQSLDCYTDAEYCAFVVSGGDDGVLRVHTYPCTSTRSNYLPYDAHGGSVTCLRILRGGSHVISAGDDHAIMIWRHEHEIVDGDGMLNAANESNPNATDMMCCTAVYDTNDQTIYPTSGVCIVLDEKRTTQTHFQRHDSNVTAVVASTSRRLIASGDNCEDFPSKIWIWDPKTCTEIISLSDSRLRGVMALAFSPNDKMLACASSDENHRIFVWSTLSGNWNDAYLSAYCLGGHEQIVFLQFAQSHDLIIGGRNCLNFYSFEPSLSVSRGDLSTAQCQGETLLCGAMMGEEKLITGTSGGTLITWNVTEKKIVNEFKAHSGGSVTSLCSCAEGIVSASSDGFISIWSHSLQKMNVYQTTRSSVIHSLDVSLHSNKMSTMKILASSDDSDCFEISCVTGNVICQIPTQSNGGVVVSVDKPAHKHNQ